LHNHFTDPSVRPLPTDRCAYLGRVSSPKQKLEHQREAVLKFADDNRLILPPERWFEDKVRRHKQLTDGKQFGRLMELAKAGEIDWILIATFDRWGISDKDDIFVFRKELKKLDVRLWCVADELEVTGSDDASFWRVAARAEAATSYVGQQAQKNIQKMLSMAKLGLAGTGNSAYGVDLVCYPLVSGHAPDLSKPMFRVIRERFIRPALYRVLHYKDGRVEREELTEKMPLRDKKATGYRYERSEDEHRIRAVNLIYGLYDSGLNFGTISEALWKQGFAHYDKPFGSHGVESILRNPIYTGRPAWGKSGVGNYCLAMNGQSVKANRKAKDPFTIQKSPEHYTQPPAPLWQPIVLVDLWERVQVRLSDRQKSDPSFGIRRQQSGVKHPLHNKVVCPDCGEKMVMGSSQSKGYTKRYYVCGLYRRTIRKRCKANSIPFATLDAAIEELLAAVKDRIDVLTSSPISPALLKEDWVKKTELGKAIFQIIEQVFPNALETPSAIDEVIKAKVHNGDILRDRSSQVFKIKVDHDTKRIIFEKVDDLLDVALTFYNAKFAEATKAAKSELVDVESELERIALTLMRSVPSATVRGTLDKRMSVLEDSKRTLTSMLVPLTTKAAVLKEQLQALHANIEESKGDTVARLLDTFVDRVCPRFEGEPIKGHARPLSVEFMPKDASGRILTEPMKFFPSRMDTDSSPPPG
jgi:Resolvase, N terminal domain/Recombinase zinc beta ribbon domain/Recombinase